ncbi:MAG: 16S rRNA (cytidine(1402)-2'-O)-methyltransferase [Anaerolineae bacterium]|jgi:16S rRNA (cytidine1402-2'-O)-methyltransferase|nr:16S rRNA (cytidine(1402)-2'-O)-methyltransferase [Anaerolineae bacterium]MBT7071695.1 16S rRNA (cytidine(1402)-2'-O)-methyltransferase [Anaerolineae bacterium]MBT7325221.1 16S rRNA (cytidine(1402)-2'-O)-methyltransferase [Anaerolineae bacterium]
MGTLYLVATPIGNLEDLSPRALRILGEVRLIAAEDTRVTGKLLSHFNISTSQISYHEHNKMSKLDRVLDSLNEGDVALVSDAGTPAINDPGYELVRAALAAGHDVSPIPGPSAPITALSASGLATDAFLYLGYLSRKSNERRAKLQEVENLPYTLIFLESPHRILKALADIQAMLGNRQIVLAREITKLYEEFFRGDVAEAQAYFGEQEPRGEFTLVVAGKKLDNTKWTEASLKSALETGMAAGESPSALAKRLSKESGWARRDIYQMIVG